MLAVVRCRGCGKALSVIYSWHKDICLDCKKKEEKE